MTEKRNNKPTKSFRSANIEASVWRQEVEQKGKIVVRYSVRVQKQFRKEDGDYQDTNYYFRDDLPKLILVSQKAFEFISLSESKEAEEPVPV